MKLTIVVVLILTVQAFEARVCPCKCCDEPNEEYRICGSMCERSCANLNDCDLCPAVCVPGCFCKDGYVRDLDGACILPCDCPPVTTTLAPTTTRKKCKCKPPTYDDRSSLCLFQYYH
nr:cysteine-rich venom protein 6-like [Aedes albopictus]